MKLRTIILEVPNLWRLEAQHGVFLFANYKWDRDYRPDRILFEYKGYPEEPRHEAVYPKRRSPLEVLLEHYFEVAAQRLGMEELEKLISRIESQGGRVLRVNHTRRDDLCIPSFVVAVGLDRRLRDHFGYRSGLVHDRHGAGVAVVR